MIDKLLKYIYYLLIVIIIIAVVWALVNWLLPLFFSCLLVAVFQPLLNREIEFLKINHQFIKKIVIVLNYLILILIMIGLIIFCVIQIYQILELMPGYLQNLYYLLSTNHYIIDLSKYLDIIYSSSISVVETISSNFIHWVINFIIKIPSFMFDLMFVIITSLFILLDYQYLETKFINRFELVSLVIATVKEVLSNMFKTYFILMIVTFGELYCGFLLIGLDQAMMLACIIAVFDFFPILGIDMFMVPWIIINAITNKIPLALGLLFIYLLVIITKNILEPRLMARKLGLNPVVSLIGMYLGIELFGVVGVFIVPIVIMVLIEIIRVKRQLKSNE